MLVRHGFRWKSERSWKLLGRDSPPPPHRPFCSYQINIMPRNSLARNFLHNLLAPSWFFFWERKREESRERLTLCSLQAPSRSRFFDIWIGEHCMRAHVDKFDYLFFFNLKNFNPKCCFRKKKEKKSTYTQLVLHRKDFFFFISSSNHRTWLLKLYTRIRSSFYVPTFLFLEFFANNFFCVNVISSYVSLRFWRVQYWGYILSTLTKFSLQGVHPVVVGKTAHLQNLVRLVLVSVKTDFFLLLHAPINPILFYVFGAS